MPLGGYVVYNSDTLEGTITLNNRSVAVKPADTSIPPATFQYADKDLQFIEVFSNELGPLVLTRANENDKELLRVVHSGKLTIYDDRYSFQPALNIDEAHARIASGKKPEPLCSIVCIDPKRSLIKAVNNTYNLKLHPQDFTLPELIYYINRLD